MTKEQALQTFTRLVREAHLKADHQPLDGEALHKQATWVAACWAVEHDFDGFDNSDYATMLVEGLQPLDLATFIEERLELCESDGEEIEEVLAEIVGTLY
jgi:hypothetical protein